MKLTKKRYLIGFMGIVAVLAVVRAEFPQLAEPRIAESHVEVNADSVAAAMPHTDFSATAIAKKHKIYSVPKHTPNNQKGRQDNHHEAWQVNRPHNVNKSDLLRRTLPNHPTQVHNTGNDQIDHFPN